MRFYIFLNIFAPLLTILNFISGIVALIWLTFLGEGGYAIVVIIASIIASFIILPIITFLPLLISTPLIMLACVSKFTQRIFLPISLFIALILSLAALCLWGIFLYDVILSDYKQELNLVPYYFLIYSCVTGPLAMIVSKENKESTIFVTYIFEIVFMISLVFNFFIKFTSLEFLILMLLIGLFPMVVYISNCLKEYSDNNE